MFQQQKNIFVFIILFAISYIFLLQAYILLFYSNHEMSCMLAFYRPLNIFLKSYYIIYIYSYINMYLYSLTAQNLFSFSARKTPCKSKPMFSN